jgi:hypothetical protein
MEPRICQVPSIDIYLACQRQLDLALAKLETLPGCIEVYEQELKEYALPALYGKFAELTDEWEALPLFEKIRTPKPSLQDNGNIIVYEKKGYRSLVKGINALGKKKSACLSEAKLIFFCDIYRFVNPAPDYLLPENISKMKQKILEFAPENGDWIEEMYERQVEFIGLNPKDYPRFRKI